MNNQYIINFDLGNNDAIIIWHHNTKSQNNSYYDKLLCSNKLNNTCISVTHINYDDYKNSLKEIRFSINNYVKNIIEFESFTFHTKYEDYEFTCENIDQDITYIKNKAYDKEYMMLHVTLQKPHNDTYSPKPAIRFMLSKL